jgi:hypothetical protein
LNDNKTIQLILFSRNLLLKKQNQLNELLDGNEVHGIDFEICLVTVKKEADFINESEKKETTSQAVDPISIPEVKPTPKTISLANFKNTYLMPNLNINQAIRIPAKVAPPIPKPATRETLKFEKSKPLLVITPQYLKTLEQQRANPMQVKSCILEGNEPKQATDALNEGEDVEEVDTTQEDIQSIYYHNHLLQLN